MSLLITVSHPIINSANNQTSLEFDLDATITLSWDYWRRDGLQLDAPQSGSIIEILDSAGNPVLNGISQWIPDADPFPPNNRQRLALSIAPSTLSAGIYRATCVGVFAEGAFETSQVTIEVSGS